MKRSIGPSWGSWFRSIHWQIHNDWILAAPYNYSFAGLKRTGIDLLVWNIGWHENKITGTCLIAEFQALTPSHSSSAANNIENSFQWAVMVRAGLGVRLYDHRASPELIRAGAGVCNRGSSCHPWSLRGVRIQLSGTHNFDAVVLPIRAFCLHALFSPAFL